MVNARKPVREPTEPFVERAANETAGVVSKAIDHGQHGVIGGMAPHEVLVPFGPMERHGDLDPTHPVING